MSEYSPIAVEFKEMLQETFPFDWTDETDNERLQYWEIIIYLIQELRSQNLGDLRCLPRPQTHPMRGRVQSDNKNTRWRQKMRRLGRCPKCGKPAAPFYECSYHRFTTFMRKMVREGHIVKQGSGKDAKYAINPKAVKHGES